MKDIGITELRNEIDSIDSEILALLEQRMEAVEKIAEIKFKSGMSTLDASREEKVIERLTVLASERTAEHIPEIWGAIMSASRAEQQKIRQKIANTF